MAYASIAGRARTSVKNPQAHAICDRCGFRYNFVDLTWQLDWRGPVIQNIRILVCRDCLDTPQEQLRAIVLPADPTPIINARTQDFDSAETNYRTLSRPPVIDPTTGLVIPDCNVRVTQDCQTRAVDPFGIPTGLEQNAVMPFDADSTMAYAVPIDVISVISDGSSVVVVNCGAPHKLVTDSQISIEGLENNAANGFYSVTVINPMTFSYETYGSIDAGSLLTPTSRIITALVGLPRGYTRIPKLWGPPLRFPPSICFLETEDGTGQFLLENGSGLLQLEMCGQPTVPTYYFETESGTGAILLEDGTDYLELEGAP